MATTAINNRPAKLAYSRRQFSPNCDPISNRIVIASGIEFERTVHNALHLVVVNPHQIRLCQAQLLQKNHQRNMEKPKDL